MSFLCFFFSPGKQELVSHWREENTRRAVEALMFPLMGGKTTAGGAESRECKQHDTPHSLCVCKCVCVRALSCALRSRSS